MTEQTNVAVAKTKPAEEKFTPIKTDIEVVNDPDVVGDAKPKVIATAKQTLSRANPPAIELVKSEAVLNNKPEQTVTVNPTKASVLVAPKAPLAPKVAPVVKATYAMSH